MLKAGWIWIACSTLVLLTGAARAQPQPIPIGIAAPLTGPIAAVGQEISRGAALAIEQINERGGVMGRRLVPVLQDDACTPIGGEQAARKMVAERVVAALALTCAGAFFRSEEFYAQANIPVLVPTLGVAHQPPISFARWKNIFRLAGRFEAQGYVAGTYMLRRFGDAPLALVYEFNMDGNDLERELSKELATAGRKFAVREQVSFSDTEFAGTIGRLKDAKVAAIYYAGGTVLGGRFLRAVRAAGIDVTFIAPSTARSDVFSGLAGPAAEGALFTFLPDARELPTAADVLPLFRRRDFEPGGYTLYAYAAVQVAAAAIEKAQSVEPGSVLGALAAERFETVIGSVKFDDNGDLVGPKFALYQWRDRSAVAFDAAPHWTKPYALPTTATRNLDIVQDAIDVPTDPSLDPQKKGPQPAGIDPLDPDPGKKGKTKKARKKKKKNGGGPRLVDVDQGVFWNVFFTRGSDLDARPNTKAASSYALTLDLSAYNYFELSGRSGPASTSVDPNVSEHLRTAPPGPVDLKSARLP